MMATVLSGAENSDSLLICQAETRSDPPQITQQAAQSRGKINNRLKWMDYEGSAPVLHHALRQQGTKQLKEELQQLCSMTTSKSLMIRRFPHFFQTVPSFCP